MSLSGGFLVFGWSRPSCQQLIPQKSHTVKKQLRPNFDLDLVTFPVQHTFMSTEVGVGVRRRSRRAAKF
jgi:hypothetical protein